MTQADARARAGLTKKRQSEARLVEATAKIVERDGVDFSLDTVAERAGLSLATVYKRFPNRSKLIVRTFNDVVSAQLSEVTNAEFRSHRVAVDRITTWLEAAFETGHTHMHLTRAALIGRLQLDIHEDQLDGDEDDDWDVVGDDPILAALILQIKDMITLNPVGNATWSASAEDDLAPLMLFLLDCIARDVRLGAAVDVAREILSLVKKPDRVQEVTATAEGFKVG